MARRSDVASPSKYCDGPVSYTHLDVYKRQHIGSVFIINKKLIVPIKKKAPNASIVTIIKYLE